MTKVNTTTLALILAIAFGACCASPSFAWNALGHKVIAEIAWRELSTEQQKSIVDTLRRHPRFDADFSGKMTDDVLTGDKADQDRWIFQHAATWPDIAREIKNDARMTWDWPTWHYINRPLYANELEELVLAPKLPFNLSADYPTKTDKRQFNVLQALAHCRRVVDGRYGLDARAVAYCWVFHLVGDIHQPLHSTALVSADVFPRGDRGGNEILLRRGRNLHSLWDNLLGRQHFMRDVDREVNELSNRQLYGDVWRTAAKETYPSKWVDESHSLCKSAVYSDEILKAVRTSNAGAKLEPIELPTAYMQEAGKHARHRVIAAGLRLAVVLGAKPKVDTEELPEDLWDSPPAVISAAEPLMFTQPKSAPRSVPQTHWLNANTNVRHNSSCRWYGNTKGGRYCSADEGKPCGQCGG